MSITVHSLRIHHRHGDDCDIYPSYDALRAALFAYVERSWDRDGPGGNIPTDRDEAISAYWDYQSEHDSEYYDTGEHTIEGAEWTQLVAA